MKLDEAGFLRFVGNGFVWRVWDAGGLFEGDGLWVVGHSVSVAARAWALMGRLKDPEKWLVPLATLGALMHDVLRIRGIEAAKRKGASGSGHSPEVNQGAFLSGLRLPGSMVDCAQPVECGSSYGIAPRADGGRLVLPWDPTVSSPRRVVVLAHHLAGDEITGEVPDTALIADSVLRLELQFASEQLYQGALVAFEVLRRDDNAN